MANRDLKWFMRDQTDEIVEAPAPPSFVDDQGKPIMMQIKKLSVGEIQAINKKYRREALGIDPKTKRPYTWNGRFALKTDESDYERAAYVMVTEALVYPDPKSKELRDFYGCVDNVEVLFKMFRTQDELTYVFDKVTEVLGISGGDAGETQELIEEAKN